MGILRHVSSGREHRLGAEHRIGRSDLCELHLLRSFVSATHAVIRWLGDGWCVADLASRNGTLVNGGRLTPGRTVPLSLGAVLQFGGPNERWRVVDVSEPTVMAVPLDGGPPLPLCNGWIEVLDGAGTPLANVQWQDGGWRLEMDGEVEPLVHGACFQVGGRSFRFESAAAPTCTADFGDHRMTAAEPCLRFRVSRDEEHVELDIERQGEWESMGSRSFYYLGLTLARVRLRHQQLGLNEHGWLETGELLNMVRDYASPQHLNVDVHRLRTTLIQAGVCNGAGIVQRRRGQIRIGTSRLVIEPLRD